MPTETLLWLARIALRKLKFKVKTEKGEQQEKHPYCIIISKSVNT